MAVWLCIRWWYTAGWAWALHRAVTQRLQWCNEMFSMTALLRTLFAPFKQTQTKGSKSIDGMVRALIDNLVSRIIGLISRSFILIVGLVCAVFVLITGVLFVFAWALIPLALPVSIVLAFMGAGA